MAKNKPVFDDPEPIIETIEIIESINEKAEEVADVMPEVLIIEKMWHGVIKVFECAKCGYSDQSKDEIILHLLKHYPENEQKEIFERLIKE